MKEQRPQIEPLPQSPPEKYPDTSGYWMQWFREIERDLAGLGQSRTAILPAKSYEYPDRQSKSVQIGIHRNA